MYQLVEAWIDNLPLDSVPDEVAAFCFNLYDECDDEHWSMELIGSEGYDSEDPDWACYEVTDFGSRQSEFCWTLKADWEAALTQIMSALREYLDKGKYSDVLKSKAAVAVGFVEGDLEMLFIK